MFKADLYNPDDWANLFEKAGAKYVVITSKHHDGYCLWPSKEANDRGFPWNSVEMKYTMNKDKRQHPTGDNVKAKKIYFKNLSYSDY